MINIIRSANLTVLKAWLIGGQNDNMGGWSEGFNTFSEFADTLKTREDVKETILHFIDEEGDYPSSWVNGTYKYWGNFYKFKRPSAKGLEKLTDIIWQFVQTQH